MATVTADHDLSLDPASPWPKMRGDARQTGRSPAGPIGPGGGAAGQDVAPWRFATGKGIFSSPVIDADGTVYIGSADHWFRAVAADGSLRWEVATGEIIDSAALLDDEGRVIVGSGDGFLYAFDRRTGDPRWTFAAQPAAETGGFISWFEGNVALAGADLLVVPNDNFRIYGIDRRTGQRRWEHVTFDQNWSCPAVDPQRGTVVVGTNFPFLANVLALDAATGEARWTAQGGGSMVASPLLTDDLAVLGSFDGIVRAFDLDTGELRWSVATRDHLYASAALGLDGTVVQPGCDGTVYGLDPQTGAVRWTHEVGAPMRASAAVDAEGHLYLGTGDGRLVVLDPDGSRRWQEVLIEGPRNDLNASPALGPNGVVLAGESGEVLFVPWEHGLRSTGRAVAVGADLAGPGGADGADGADRAELVVATPFGALEAGPPEPIDANAPLTLVLRVTEGGRRVLAHLDDERLAVAVDPPTTVDVDVSGDRTFVVVTPQEPWAAPDGGRVRVSVTAPFLVEPEREGLRFTGGRPGGTAERTLDLVVRPRPPSPVALAAGYELYRVAAPLPTILPSYNQIGFDSIHYLIGVVELVGGRGVAWAVGGRLDPHSGAAVVDPTANTRFPLEVHLDGDLVTFSNERGFTIEFNGFPLPFESFRVAARLAADGTGRPVTSPSLVARADANAIDFYGPFLQQLGYCHPTTGLLVVSGGAELRPHQPAPAPVAPTPTFRLDGARVVADVPTGADASAGVNAGADADGIAAAEHNVGLLVLDGDGRPLPLAYATGTEVVTDGDGRVTSVAVPLGDAAAPGGARPARAVLLADTTVVAIGTLTG